jgi:serine protease Do
LGKKAEMGQLLQQLNLEMAGIVNRVQPSLVHVNNGRGGDGAGTIWHPDGLVITNAHVIEGHRQLTVALPDGTNYPARLLAADPQRDLAALSIDAAGLPTIALGQLQRLQPGQWVLAMGHPWGVPGAATAGIVISLGKPPEMAAGRGEFIQVGLHLRPGYSGGPLVDELGRLVGVNTMIAGPEVGLAVPVHTVKAFLQETLGTPKAAAEYI